MGRPKTSTGHTIPTMMDVIMAYSSRAGYELIYSTEEEPKHALFPCCHRCIAVRDIGFGSWFIKVFVDTMRELATEEHFTDILTVVSRRVAIAFYSKNCGKQMPTFVSYLTRKLYFNPPRSGTS